MKKTQKKTIEKVEALNEELSNVLEELEANVEKVRRIFILFIF